MNKDQEERNEKIIDQFDYLGNAASSGDCTGLIPFSNGNDDPENEFENYQEIYRFGAPVIDREK